MTANTNTKTVIISSVVAVIIAVAASFGFCKTCCKQNELGVVDLQRVVSVSKDVAALRTNREAQVKELQKMADDANKEIDKIKDENEKKAATEKYLAEIQVKKNEFDNAYATELQASDKKIQNIIDSVAEKKNLSVVLNKSSVVSGGIDITEAVVDLVK